MPIPSAQSIAYIISPDLPPISRMASSALDSAIKQALRELKKESAQLTIKCLLKKHLTIIKDLIGSGLSLAIIADRLSQAGVTGNTKDIIAAINALVGTEASIALSNS